MSEATSWRRPETLHPWEQGPMVPVVRVVGVTYGAGPMRVPVYGYLLACGHTIGFHAADQKLVSCTTCGLEIRGGP